MWLSWDAKPTTCCTFRTSFQLYLRHKMNCLKAGVGQAHWDICACTRKHTHANTDISRSKIETVEGIFISLILFLRFASVPRTDVTRPNFRFRNCGERTCKVIWLLYYSPNTHWAFFGYVLFYVSLTLLKTCFHTDTSRVINGDATFYMSGSWNDLGKRDISFLSFN